ncbi:MAG: succinate--CoA ligase subunit beta [Timaviella obliquedivisa GSE-PSE-MK23-08B]|jgi:succinyl-CoA synthetase beta subunit|nr:succinate--CoA ligase subunit beta [Timaviella obliquedivisa GSE-PSE-MK23-08B]
MDLLEYQAKDLFHQMGIPVLPSQRIAHPRDLKGLKISYPVVLKSQVRTGGRSKAGGIKFVENTIDAVAAAQAIFHLPIMGCYPEVLLAEAKYNPDREFYLAIMLDSSTRRPLMLGSRQGGVDVESKLEHMQQVVVDQEFSSFYARRLALKMGLEGELIQSVSSVIEKMYNLFIQQDLDLIEINPLAVSTTGELMALDGRVVAEDAALGRRSNIAAFIATIPDTAPSNLSGDGKTKLTSDLKRVQLEGNIGVLCNGAGLMMATLDLIQSAKGKTASFVDIGGEYRYNCPPETLQERLQQGLDLILADKTVKAVLVNVLGSVISCRQVAEGMTFYLRNRKNTPPIVVRLVGDRLEQAAELLAKSKIPMTDSLEDAIAKTVILSQS